MEQFFKEGLQLLEQGHPFEAIEAFTASIDLIADATCFCYRGLARFKINELDKALSDYNKAIELEANSIPEVYYFRGMLYQKMGNYGEALIDLSKAIELKGQIWIGEAYYHRAATFAAVGEHDMGVDDMMAAARSGFTPAQDFLLSEGLSW